MPHFIRLFARFYFHRIWTRYIYTYIYTPAFENTIICIRSIHSVFYPLGCVAGYKLDDDILAYTELVQNMWCYFSKSWTVAIQIISVSRMTNKPNNVYIICMIYLIIPKYAALIHDIIMSNLLPEIICNVLILNYTWIPNISLNNFI